MTQEMLIEIDDVSRSYGSVEAVKGLALAVGAGEIFGLLGPNGAGKTTTMELMVGMLRPTRGAVRFCGKDVLDDPVGSRRLMGYVPDVPQLFEFFTGWEYLALAAEAHRLAEDEAHARAATLLDKLDLVAPAARPMGQYSLGQTKKIALAAALLHRPRILILDEPTAALDPISTLVVEDLLREEAGRGAAVVLSTHLLVAAQELCHRVGLMKGGQLLAAGTPRELIERTGTAEKRCQTLTDVFHVLMERAPGAT